MKKAIKSITNFYNKLSDVGKILLFTTLLLTLVVFFKKLMPIKEGMSAKDSNKFTFLQGGAVYDDFYADIYDYLVFNDIKNDFEYGVITTSTTPTETSVIADIGCGTGHHVAELSAQKLNVIGIDVSPAMIEKAKKTNPEDATKFKVGDGLDNYLFTDNSLTHILCLYFTIYYMKDKTRFFYNCMNWLMPGGYLMVHLVNKHKFDPILPPGNPLYIVSPQKYAKERITKTKIAFNDFAYESQFNLDDNNEVATFNEKFKFKDGRVRKQEQKLYMEDLESIVNIAQEAGFIIHAKVDMVKCAYENQYIYIFVKPG